MELFNYIRNSGYERESAFVNDVKYHPVLKAKKTFASGILAAFMNADIQPGKAGATAETESTPKSPLKPNIPTTSESSFFGLLKKKVSL